MPTRSQRPIVDKLLSLEPLEVGSHRDLRFTGIDQALLQMGTDFTAEELAVALSNQTDVKVSTTLLYRWRREIGDE
jgi:hypothetical protein